MEAAITFEQWNLDFQEASAALAHAQASIKWGAGFVGIAVRLWDSAFALKRIVRMQESLERNVNGWPGLEPALAKLATNTFELASSADGLFEVGAHGRLTNRSLTGAPLQSIRKYSEEIRDFAERLQISPDPTLRDDIAEALEEYRSGETVSLEDLR
jgi:hypothetical protein